MPSIKPYLKPNNIFLSLLGLVAVIGFIDATYLTVTHYTQALVPCNFTQACETVLRSSYSEVVGIPIAAFGVIFYITTLTAVVFFLQHKTYHWWLTMWGLIGFFSSLYLLYVMAFVLQAFCQYCLLSSLTSTLVFILTLILYILNRKERAHAKKS